MTTNIFKPILFNTEMVQAILAGRKTQTRRCFDKQPKADDGKYEMKKHFHDFGKIYFAMTLKDGIDDFPFHGFFYPKYQPGDILWVRETFTILDTKKHCGDFDFLYKASYEQDFYRNLKWKPSLFMPKEAARIFLKITNVRCERLQDISEDDARLEGMEKSLTGSYKLYGRHKIKNYRGHNPRFGCPVDSFQTLWDSINAKKQPWESNPWVWVYDFERIEKPENFI